MAKCPKCNRPITCGCQYTKLNGQIIGCEKCTPKNKKPTTALGIILKSEL